MPAEAAGPCGKASERDDRSLKDPAGPKYHKHHKLLSKEVPRQCRGGFFACCCKRAGSKPGAGAAALLRLCHAELASAVSRRAGLRLGQRQELAGELDSEPRRG